MTPEERLAELGLAVPEVAAPVAAYVPAVRSGDLVFTSGQLPMRAGELIAIGKVGGEVSPEEATECAQQCASNAIAAVRAEVGELSRVARIVKVVVFVASTPDFTGSARGGERGLGVAGPGLRRRRRPRPVGRGGRGPSAGRAGRGGTPRRGHGWAARRRLRCR